MSTPTYRYRKHDKRQLNLRLELSYFIRHIYEFILSQPDLPINSNSASSSPALSANHVTIANHSLEKNPRNNNHVTKNVDSLDRVTGGAQTSVHYQNHTLYQIHHHHYHHMLMTEDCHKDPLEIPHLKYRELNAKEEQFSYAGDHGESTVGIKSTNHSSLLMGSLFPASSSSSPVAPNSAPTAPMDETADYKHSRDLWFHEGNNDDAQLALMGN